MNKKTENLAPGKALTDPPATGDWIRETITDKDGNLVAIIEREYHPPPAT